MSILSINFLCFAGLMIAVYYILPPKIRCWSLLGFSAAFVVSVPEPLIETSFLALMVFSVLTHLDPLGFRTYTS